MVLNPGLNIPEPDSHQVFLYH